MGFFYGYGYGILIIGMLITMMASSKLRSTYAKYGKVLSRSGLTGRTAAQQILAGAGLTSVRIEHIQGSLTDNYSPMQQVLHLSDSTDESNSIAAIGVAAHECGHAMQHDEGYAPLRFRSALVPVANFGSKISWPLILIGVVVGGLGSPLVQIGILMFTMAVLFQLVTLPVEFNASSRAVKLLDSQGILVGEEVKGTRSVLSAAALTYVAAAATSMLQLLRLIILYGGRRRDD
jgi:Zn-dependent membrane protease YugP